MGSVIRMRGFEFFDLEWNVVIILVDLGEYLDFKNEVKFIDWR